MPALAVIPRETHPGVDEARLIREVRAGHKEAFEYFVRQYQPKITRVAYRLLRDLGEADCAAQESFLRAWQNLDDFILVDDAEMREAVAVLFRRCHALAEYSGAAALAGALKMRDEIAGKKVAVIISGGNITEAQIQRVLAET